MISTITGRGAPAVALQVRAHLAAGTVQAAPWGIALDGLLAAETWSDHKAAAADQGLPIPEVATLPEDLPLPLARCEGSGGDTWHWASTCAFPEQRADVDVRYWSSRLDHRAAEQAADHLPNVLSDRQGRYQARRMPLITMPCSSIVWWAVGDIAAIRSLVTPITAIGKKRSQGEGHVLRWDVTELRDVDPWTAAHLHPDHSLGRPTPSSCLEGHTVIGDGGFGTAGLRPPYMHPARQHELHLPALLEHS